MSTFVLIDPGAGVRVPLKLETDQGGGLGAEFRIDAAGDLEIVRIGVGSIGFSAIHTFASSRFSFGTTSDPVGFSRAIGVSSDAGEFVLHLQHANAVTPLGLFINYSGQTGGETNTTSEAFLLCQNANFGVVTKAYISSDGGFHNRQANDTDLSDEDLKDISSDPVEDMWTKAKALKIINYREKKFPDTRMLIGLGAQQVKTVLPDCVKDRHFDTTPAKDAYDEVDADTGATRRIPARAEVVRDMYAEIYMKDIQFVFFKALQEAMTRIEALEV